MASESKKKVILITGATGGIGRATAIAFAREGGYNLALHYNSASKETRDEVTSAIRNAARDPCQADFFQADLGDYDSVRALYTEAKRVVGDVDVLFNNAGADAGIKGPASLTDVPIDTFERAWRINTGSGILLTQLCLPYMEAQEWGRIIFDSSVAAFTGGYVGPHYASAKSAQHGFIHWLAGNVAKKGVTVNGVAPALVGGTNMMGDNDEEETGRRVAASEFCFFWRVVLRMMY